MAEQVEYVRFQSPVPTIVAGSLVVLVNALAKLTVWVDLSEYRKGEIPYEHQPIEVACRVGRPTAGIR